MFVIESITDNFEGGGAVLKGKQRKVDRGRRIKTLRMDACLFAKHIIPFSYNPQYWLHSTLVYEECILPVFLDMRHPSINKTMLSSPPMKCYGPLFIHHIFKLQSMWFCKPQVFFFSINSARNSLQIAHYPELQGQKRKKTSGFS